MRTLQIIEHFAEDDEECGGDYWSVEVLADGVRVQQYGDDYHDDGASKASGFVDGYCFAYPDCELLKKERVADGELY